MIKKYKFHITAVVVAVLVIATLMSKDKSELIDNKSVESGSNTLSGVEGSGNSLQGILQVSDNKELGDYKLVTELGDIYIRTGRDYGNLAGSEVVVAIDGIPESFRLIDIYANPQ